MTIYYDIMSYTLYYIGNYSIYIEISLNTGGTAMTENDVKRLNRSELLQLLIEQTKRNEDLEAELAKANKQLDDRAIMVNEAGSIAEASLKLNDVFGSAQAAAEQYLENIRLLYSRQEEICTKRDEESRQRAAQIINDAEETAARRIKRILGHAFAEA